MKIGFFNPKIWGFLDHRISILEIGAFYYENLDFFHFRELRIFKIHLWKFLYRKFTIFSDLAFFPGNQGFFKI